MTAPHPDPEELMASLDGEVAADRDREIRTHLEACASCAALADQLRCRRRRWRDGRSTRRRRRFRPACARWSGGRAMRARRHRPGVPGACAGPSSRRWCSSGSRCRCACSVSEASSVCPLDRVGHLLGTGRSPNDSRPSEAPGNARRSARWCDAGRRDAARACPRRRGEGRRHDVHRLAVSGVPRGARELPRRLSALRAVCLPAP